MAEKSAVDRFDRTAANYATSPHHVGGRSLERLVEVAQPAPSMVVLDLACGPGHTSLVLAPRVARVVAYDPAPNMLLETEKAARARGLKNLETRRGLAEQLLFEDATFDLVVSRIAPHHFADVERSVRELARVLKPGGRGVVADLVGFEDPEVDEFNHGLETLHDPTHVRSYTMRRWREIFGQAGLALFHEEQFREPEDGLLVSEWCRVAQTPPENAAEIRRRCLGASPRIKEALVIGAAGDDVRLGARRIGVIGGLKS